MSDGFRDRVVLVTGGSRGIGRALAAELYYEGARVVIGSRDPEQLKKAATTIAARGARAGAAGGELVPVRLDVTLPEAVAAVVSRVVETWGRVDVLIHAAAAPLDDLSRMTRACLPHIPEAGRIITIVRTPDPASRDAVSRLTKNLAGELAPRRIIVNSMCLRGTGGADEGRVVGMALEWASAAAGSITGQVVDVGGETGG